METLKKMQNIGQLQSNFSSEYSQKNKIKNLYVDRKFFFKRNPKEETVRKKFYGNALVCNNNSQSKL